MQISDDQNSEDSKAGQIDHTKPFSINEYCKWLGISRTTHFDMKRRGIGPKEVKVLGRCLIRRETAVAWLAALEGEAVTK